MSASAVSPFVAEWLPHVARELGVPGTPGRALDLAMGSGRHTLALATAGFSVFGVDRAVDRLRIARGEAAAHAVRLHQWAADLDTYPLPRAWADLLLCTRFLLRARWADLQDLVRPGGFVIYETFTVGQLALGVGPTSAEHLLQAGELREAFSAWDVRFSEEVAAPAAVARLVARRPGA
jgi:SAM-dependent methyltransferase